MLIITAELGDRAGEGLWLSAILMKESSLCKAKHGTLDPRAYGCGQLHLPTAKWAAGQPVTVKQLMTNDRLNIELAQYVLTDCMTRFPENVVRGIACYKYGYPYAYTGDIKQMNEYAKSVAELRSQLYENLQSLVAQPPAPKQNSTSHFSPLTNSQLEGLVEFDEIQGALEFQDCKPCQSALADALRREKKPKAKPQSKN